MTRWASLLAVLAVCGAGTLAVHAAEPASKGDAILGKWWFPEKNGKLDVRREGDAYFGKVIDYDDKEAVDEHNPDPKLQTRPFIGIEMLANFKYDAPNSKWIDGTIYDGKSGKTYSCSMWFENNDTAKLNARGYIGISLFGRTEIFSRVTKADEEAEAKQAAEKKAAEDKAAEDKASDKKSDDKPAGKGESKS